VIGKLNGTSSRIISAAIVGGTASKLSGGKFANGAMTAVFSRTFNDEFHEWIEEYRNEALRDVNTLDMSSRVDRAKLAGYAFLWGYYNDEKEASVLLRQEKLALLVKYEIFDSLRNSYIIDASSIVTEIASDLYGAHSDTVKDVLVEGAANGLGVFRVTNELKALYDISDNIQELLPSDTPPGYDVYIYSKIKYYARECGATLTCE